MILPVNFFIAFCLVSLAAAIYGIFFRKKSPGLRNGILVVGLVGVSLCIIWFLQAWR